MEKDLQLCGLGNGLIDLQFEIEDKHLKGLEVKKGEMALVDSDKQKNLIDSFSGLDFHKSSGGSAANTIIAFARFGGRAAYQTVLGKDEFGMFYSNEFKDLGIELYAEASEKHPTGTCLVLITPDSERTMLTSLGASATFNTLKVNEDSIKRSQWLYIEGYEFSQKESTDAVFKAIEIAKQNDTKVAVTFSDAFITDNFRDNLKFAILNADLVFCNENEATNFTFKPDINSAAVTLGSMVPNLVITLGEKGSLIKWADEVYTIPGYKATPVDSTGAGDMYAGAFMYGLMNMGSAYKAGHLASYASALVVSQMGARLNADHRQIKDELMEKIK